MKIKVGDYILIQDGVTFNLVQVIKSEETTIEEVDGKRIRVKTGRLVDREVEMGYNMSIDYCLKKIIMNNLDKKDVTVNLQEWLKMYREEREIITNLMNNLI